jgi:hypothetical protein
MKLVLTIEASAATIAAVLTAIDGVQGNVAITGTDSNGIAPPAIGTVPTPPVPLPVPQPVAVPSPVPPVAADDDEAGDTAAAPGQTDGDGLPWDDRIHSNPPKLTGKGIWRKRRGVDDATVAAVEAELRAGAAPAPVPHPVQPIAAPAPVPVPHPVPVPPQPMPVQQPVPVPPAMPAPIPAMPVAPVAPVAAMPDAAALQEASNMASGDLTGAQFMQHIADLTKQVGADGQPRVHAEYLASLTAKIGEAYQVQLNMITDILAQPHMLKYAVQLMQADGRW